MKLIITTLLLGLSLTGFTQATWQEIESGTDKNLIAISFGSSSVGYIGGEDSLLLKTTDGGLSWNQVDYSGVSFTNNDASIVDLEFVSDQVGYMTVGPFSGTYKTTDGGTSWTPLGTPKNMCYNQGLFFWDEENGYIGGSGCFQGEIIQVLSDGELSTAAINSSSNFSPQIVVDIDFLNNDFGLAASEGRFLRTTNGGANWDTIPSGVVHPLTSVEIINDTLAYAGYIDEQSSGFGILVTHDGGLNWTMDSQMATFFYPDYTDVHESSNGNIYVTAATDFPGYGSIFQRLNGIWYPYSVDNSLNALDSYGDSTVFAVGDSGLVVTNLNSTLNNAERPTRPGELRIYPNPAYDQINFEISEERLNSGVRLRIWNSTGKLIRAETVNNSVVRLENMSPGIYILEVGLKGKRYSKRFIKR